MPSRTIPTHSMDQQHQTTTNTNNNNANTNANNKRKTKAASEELNESALNANNAGEEASTILLALHHSSSSPRSSSPTPSSSSTSPPSSPPSSNELTASGSAISNEDSPSQQANETKCMLNDCALCVRGVPMLLVRSPTWASIMRVVFYCLQYDKKDRVFFNLKTDIYGFIISHWNKLSLNKKRSDNWHKQIQDMLSHSKNLFESGMEKYKQNGFWRMKQNHDPWTMHKPRSYNWTKRANRSTGDGADSEFITVFDVTTGAVVQEGDIESPRKRIKGGEDDSDNEQSRHNLEDEIKSLREALASMSENLNSVKEELKKKDQEMMEKAYNYQKTLEQLEALKLAHSQEIHPQSSQSSSTSSASTSPVVPPFNSEAFSAISPRNNTSSHGPESSYSPRNISEAYSPRNISETYSPRNVAGHGTEYSPRTSALPRHLAPYPTTPPPLSRHLEPAHYPSPPPTHLAPNFPPPRPIFPPSFELSLAANNRRFTPPPLSFPPEGLSSAMYNHYPANFPPPPSSSTPSASSPFTPQASPSSSFEFKSLSHRYPRKLFAFLY